MWERSTSAFRKTSLHFLVSVGSKNFSEGRGIGNGIHVCHRRAIAGRFMAGVRRIGVSPQHDTGIRILDGLRSDAGCHWIPPGVGGVQPCIAFLIFWSVLYWLRA